MGNDSNRSIWNFDEARMRDLHYHMVLIEESFENWDVETINKKIQIIELIVSGADWRDDEWKKIEKEFSKIEEMKRDIDKSDNWEFSNHKKIEFYNGARKIYKTINRKMQDKGFFFRTKEDEGL